MITSEHPLVKLLEVADKVYFENEIAKGRGRPYRYSPRSMFKCLIVKTVKCLTDCSGLYNYLSHKANQPMRQMVGLSEQLPCLKTFQRRFEHSSSLMRRQIQVLAKALAKRGVISFEMLAVDGTVCDALGPDWHKSDKLYTHLPTGLRNLDLLAEWGKSGYHGWTYGYKALAFCNISVKINFLLVNFAKLLQHFPVGNFTTCGINYPPINCIFTKIIQDSPSPSLKAG